MLERIYRAGGYLKISDAETKQILASKCNVDVEKFKKIIEACVKFGLFDKGWCTRKNVLTSQGILRRMKPIIVKRLKMQEKYTVVSDAETEQNPAETIPETRQSKVKESKVNKRKEKKEIYTPEFEEFWKECLKREDKKYTFTCYQKRLGEGITHVQILGHIKAYSKKHKEEKTEMQFIKNPSTFLNKTEFRELPNYTTTQKGESLADKYAGIGTTVQN